VGALLVLWLSVWRSNINRDARIATSLLAVGLIGWLICESRLLWGALGDAYLFAAIAWPAAGLFWLFVATVFEERRVTPLTLLPSALLLVSGAVMNLSAQPAFDVIWSARNIFGGLLALHAGLFIVRGWRDDLVEGRRRLRAVVLGLSALYALVEVVVSFAHRLDPNGPWLGLAVGELWGGMLLSALTLAVAALFLQARPSVFGAPRRTEAVVDGRVEAADRLTLQRLDGVMAAEAWRREGLTIGDLSAELDLPEHRLRRLINGRLGHRNFAEFVNTHRIAAAKRRLADPAEARTTVAAIAFDLGYGSLGPFNRAFRAATGATPTEWRREALAQASPELQEAV
jgi:AraC-like DNA-binding protein